MLGFCKILEDGTINTRSKKIDDNWINISLLETYQDGSYATYYKTDGSLTEDGKIPIDTVKENLKKAKDLKEIYENYYENLIQDKLKELDYKNDGSTVAMYASIPTSIYYNECISLITWRENIIKKNYEILGSINEGIKFNQSWLDIIPTKEEYLSELPTL